MSRKHWWALSTTILLIAYAVVGRIVPHPGHARLLSAFGNAVQLSLLLTFVALSLRNGITASGKARYFWWFLALGPLLWIAATSLWVWYAVVLVQPPPRPFLGDMLFFIHVLPMLAALSLRPHRAHSLRHFDFGTVDFAMLLLWWVYLYVFIVVPWQYVVHDVNSYLHNFGTLYMVEDAAYVVGLLFLTMRVRGAWQGIYTKLLVAASISTVGGYLVMRAVVRGAFHTGSLYDLPLLLSICISIYAAMEGHKIGTHALPEPPQRVETAFVSRVAMLSVLSLPLIGAWGTFMQNTAAPVVSFRLKITAVALLVLPLCVFVKQHFLDRELVRLLAASQRNVGNLKRLQAQLVQSEKLASLGEVVAGAAHQISNPLTAIIGYSDLLEQEYPSEDERGSWVRKIGQQARRTQDLLKQMLNFSKQAPAEKLLIDVNRVVADAVELRLLDLDNQNIRILQKYDSKLPHLWADSNQLLQVFFHIIGNAIDAMKGVGRGTLTVTTRFENGAAFVEFADTGTGVADPQRIFDPFYTTKPVGKGAGLGLSAAYGIVSEHGGTIVCHNRPEGGAIFVVRFPIAYPSVQEEATQTVHA